MENNSGFKYQITIRYLITLNSDESSAERITLRSVMHILNR